PLSVPTYSLPSASTNGAFWTVPSGCRQSSLPVSRSKAFRRDPFSTWYTLVPSITGDENPNWSPLNAHFVDLMSPVSEPSITPIMPSSLVSKFSSPWDTTTVVPFTTTPVLIARLAATKLQTFSPVCGFIAWIAPSPVPAMRSRMPLIVAIVGIAYAVSYGRPPGDATQTISPVRLSSAMKRCARLAWPPQLEIAALTITRSPSTIGDIVRPPCVVNAANSSPTERCQSSLPLLSSATTSAPTPSA